MSIGSEVMRFRFVTRELNCHSNSQPQSVTKAKRKTEPLG